MRSVTVLNTSTRLVSSGRCVPPVNIILFLSHAHLTNNDGLNGLPSNSFFGEATDFANLLRSCGCGCVVVFTAATTAAFSFTADSDFAALFDFFDATAGGGGAIGVGLGPVFFAVAGGVSGTFGFSTTAVAVAAASAVADFFVSSLLGFCGGGGGGGGGDGDGDGDDGGSPIDHASPSCVWIDDAHSVH